MPADCWGCFICQSYPGFQELLGTSCGILSRVESASVCWNEIAYFIKALFVFHGEIPEASAIIILLRSGERCLDEI